MAFPAALGFFGRLVSKLVGPTLWAILGLLGLTVVAYVGIDTALDQLKNYVIAQVGGMSVEIIEVLGAVKFDVYVTMIFSAITARLTFKGLSGGVMKVFRWGG